MLTTKPDEKILSDLSTLNEQISLAQSMLVNAGPLSSITNDTNEALLTVIGFLEACVPRMVELIEAAASGALKPEVSIVGDLSLWFLVVHIRCIVHFKLTFIDSPFLQTFEECLTVNDKLTNILADVEKDPKDRQPLTQAASAATSTSGDNVDIEEDMNKLSVTGTEDNNAFVAGGKTTGLDSVDLLGGKTAENNDPFASGPDLLAPTSTTTDPFKISDSMGSSDEVQAKAADNDDDFDAFFRDRTAAP